jgi:hypothetical protein
MNEGFPADKNLCIPALCSAKRAPTRSEYFKNLSVQFITHCSYEDPSVRRNVRDNVEKYELARIHELASGDYTPPSS